MKLEELDAYTPSERVRERESARDRARTDRERERVCEIE